MDFDSFMRSRAGRAAVAQFESELTARRAALIDEKVAARAERDAALRELIPELEAATATVTRLRAELERSEVMQQNLERSANAAKASCSAKLKRIDRELIATADGRIDEFCQQLEKECVELRSGLVVSADRRRSNAASLERRLRALRSAIDAAQSLKTQDVADLEVELEQLSASVPEVQLEPEPPRAA